MEEFKKRHKATIVLHFAHFDSYIFCALILFVKDPLLKLAEVVAAKTNK